VSHTVTAAVAGLVGLAVVGPVANHAIVWWTGWRVVLPPALGRVPAAAEVGSPPGRCWACQAPLAPGGLRAIPAAVVAGRCRRCHARLAGRYLAVDLVTAGLFAVTGAVVGWSAALLPLLALAAGSVAMSAVDLATMRIPTRFVYVTGAAVVTGLVVASAVDPPLRRLAGAAVGAAVYGGALLVLHLASPRALGFGDVRLATLVGAVAGWCAWRPDHPVLAPLQGAVNAGLLAGLIGSAVGLVLLVVRGRDRHFPFGPAIAAGGMVVALAAV
jgi:leader peptidase (prepilin peptidase)/N-methyltransferase